MLAFLDHVDDRHGSMHDLVRGLGVADGTLERLRASLVD
jgi:hypothetical protein